MKSDSQIHPVDKHQRPNPEVHHLCPTGAETVSCDSTVLLQHHHTGSELKLFGWLLETSPWNGFMSEAETRLTAGSAVTKVQQWWSWTTTKAAGH